ncbi:MAG TPA: hypothetical protein VFY48_01305 [Solirubrobacterales bacterium]|nr:hypothetical protein [Solirubrobacterales bacterium]
MPAGAIADLACRPVGKKGSKILWLRRARIVGDLELTSRLIGVRLRFEDCEFENEVNLDQAEAVDIAMFSCVIGGRMRGYQLRVQHNVVLHDSTLKNGLALMGAHIGGQLSMNGSTLEGGPQGADRTGAALSADGIEVNQGIFCRGGFTAKGALRVIGAMVGGQFSLTGAHLEGLGTEDGQEGPSICGDRMEVRGNFHCDEIDATGEMRLLGARVGGQLSFRGATLAGGRRERSGLQPALNVDGIEVTQGMYCDEGFSAKGEVRMVGATVRGQLTLAKSVLEGAEAADQLPGLALTADRLRVTGSMYCDECEVVGGIHLSGASIGGQLSLVQATIDGKGRGAVVADDLVAVGSVLLPDLKSRGSVSFSDAKVGGQLMLNGATLDAGDDIDGVTPAALIGDRMEVAGSAYFRSDFSAKGEVSMVGAIIKGQLSMNGATIECGRIGPDTASFSLNCDGIEVERGMYCRDGFNAKGEVRLMSARIGSQLSMQGATLAGVKGKDGTADSLCGDGMAVEGGLVLDGCRTTGDLRLLGATIREELSLNRAVLRREEGARDAFSADNATVGGNLFCSGVTVTGVMRFQGIRVKGQLAIVEAEIDGGKDSGVNLVAAVVGELILAFVSCQGVLDLRRATVESLWDAEAGQFLGQAPAGMRLEGCTYESLREPLEAKQRLEWIERSQGDRHYPGVYSQLATAFRRIGHRGDARMIEIASERRARRDSKPVSFRGIGHDLLWVTIGYGYRNWLAALWLSGLILVGAALFALDESSFVATIRNPPDFDPLLFAIDITIPVLDLGQTRAWSATGCMAWVGLVLAVSGYALVAAVIAAAAGVFNRDQV